MIKTVLPLKSLQISARDRLEKKKVFFVNVVLIGCIEFHDF